MIKGVQDFSSHSERIDVITVENTNSNLVTVSSFRSDNAFLKFMV
jgi:hypothetical protein